MTKSLFCFLGIILILGLALGCRETTIQQACFQNHCFDLEIADDAKERARGLMFRESLSSQTGMLFVFAHPDQYSFWMKNTKIPLDIIWLDQEKNVVFIYPDAQPCPSANCPSILPPEKAQYVLELNAGSSQKIGLNVGAKLEFR